jgi:hypothetical protein
MTPPADKPRGLWEAAKRRLTDSGILARASYLIMFYGLAFEWSDAVFENVDGEHSM